MVTNSEQVAPAKPPSADGESTAPTFNASLGEIIKLASTLNPEDRLRLIAGVWASLPPWHTAAPMPAQLPDLQQELDEYDAGGTGRFGWAAVRRLIVAGCPSEPAKIYSAPRRFDLSTIFVVTLAYSLLFGTMAGLSFPPAMSVIIGAFILLVAAGQALLFGGKQPRTASLIVGTLIFTLAMLTYWIAIGPRLYPVSAMLIVGSYVVIGGGILGYLAGVLIGGVFLIADKLRKRFSHERGHDGETDTQIAGAGGDSPWAN